METSKLEPNVNSCSEIRARRSNTRKSVVLSQTPNVESQEFYRRHLRTCGPSAKVLARNPNANETILPQRGASNSCGHVSHQQRFSRETQTRTKLFGTAWREQHVRACGPSAKVLARKSNANENSLVQHGRCNICCHGSHRQGHSATRTRTSRVWRSVARAAAAILAVGKVTPRLRREQPGCLRNGQGNTCGHVGHWRGIATMMMVMLMIRGR